MIRSLVSALNARQESYTLAIFQADFWIIFASSVLWAYLAILDAKRVGLTDVNVWMAGVLLVVESVLVGPGAVVSGVRWSPPMARARPSRRTGSPIVRSDPAYCATAPNHNVSSSCPPSRAARSTSASV